MYKILTSVAYWICRQVVRHRSQDQGPWTQNDPGQRSQEGGAREEEPGQRSQDRGARTEEPGQRSQDRGPRTEDPGQRTQDSEQKQRIKEQGDNMRCYQQQRRHSASCPEGFSPGTPVSLTTEESIFLNSNLTILPVAETAQCTLPRGFFSGYSGFPHY